MKVYAVISTVSCHISTLSKCISDPVSDLVKIQGQIPMRGGKKRGIMKAEPPRPLFMDTDVSFLIRCNRNTPKQYQRLNCYFVLYNTPQ